MCCIIPYWRIGGAVSLCFCPPSAQWECSVSFKGSFSNASVITTRKDTKKDDWWQCRSECVIALDVCRSVFMLLADRLIWFLAQVDHLPHWSAEPRKSASASVGKTATHTNEMIHVSSTSVHMNKLNDTSQ